MKHLSTASAKGKFFKVLHGTSDAQIAMMTLKPGQSTADEPVNEHPRCEQWMFILSGSGRAIYMPFRGESLGAGTPDRVRSRATSTSQDPWDKQPTKEEAFNQKVRAVTGIEPKDLDPIVDGLRTIKSPAEIAVIREATRIASVGILEAMKSAKPGMKEY